MSYVKYNPNPKGHNVGDCVIRALSIALGLNWDATYIKLAMCGLSQGDMPSANHVWGAFLMQNGFKRHTLPNECPECYSVRDFANDHPEGTYVLATGTHAIAVRDGKYYDSWDSGDEVPMYYFEKDNESHE